MFSLHINAQNYDSLLTLGLSKSTKTLSITDNKLTGPGAEFLYNEASRTQFFLIGEDHGVAEVAQFTNALFNRLNNYEYKHYATEVGPNTAKILQKIIASESSDDEFKNLFKQYPWSIPFFNWKDETEVLATAHRINSKNGIWGLDQEFIGSPRIIFQELLKNVPNQRAKELINQYFEDANNKFKTSLETKRPATFLDQSDKEVFEQIRKVAKGKSAQYWINVANELEVSQDVYLKYFRGQGFASNQQRAELMKKHFLEYYKEAEKTTPNPKVLVKLGANHTYRGTNYLNAYDIGNFLNEFASLNQTKSFHLLVISLKGTQNAFNPFASEKDKQKPYDKSKEEFLKPILPLLDAKKMTVIDVRTVREKLFYGKIKNLNPKLEKIIWSFDAVMVIPETHASTLFTDLIK